MNKNVFLIRFRLQRSDDISAYFFKLTSFNYVIDNHIKNTSQMQDLIPGSNYVVIHDKHTNKLDLSTK